MADNAIKDVTEAVVEYADGKPRLIGSKCNACGAVAFPARGSCSRCTSEDMTTHLLNATGSLWGFTIQGFSPKVPYLGAGEPFEPFGVGYVNLEDEVLVESRLLASSPEELRTGMPMKLVVSSFAGGHTAYAFTPAGDEEGPK